MLCVRCCLLRVIYRVSFAACWVSGVACRLFGVAGPVLRVRCCVFRVRCFRSFVVCPVLSVVCPLFGVACCVLRVAGSRYGSKSRIGATLTPSRPRRSAGGGGPSRRLPYRRQGGRWCLGAPERAAGRASLNFEGGCCGETLEASHWRFLEGRAGAARIEPWVRSRHGQAVPEAEYSRT